MKIKKNVLIVSLVISSTIASAQNWKIIPSTGTSQDSREFATSFTISNRAYVGFGRDCNYVPINDLWEFDLTNNNWISRASLPGGARCGASSFVIDSVAYVMFGNNSISLNTLNDVWTYSPTTNSWNAKAMFPGTPRAYAFSFSLNGKGYIGGGVDANNNSLSDVWEYNPINDSWLQKADFSALSYAMVFEMGNTAFVGMGIDGGQSIRSEFYEYNPIVDKWKYVTKISGAASFYAQGFVLCGNGYVIPSYTDSLFMFSPSNSTFTFKGNAPSDARAGNIAFSLQTKDGPKGFYGFGRMAGTSFCNSNIWEYSVDSCLSVGIEELKNEKMFSIYPNPTTDYLKIKSYSDEAVSIKITDILGKTVYSSLNTKNDINCIDWPNGIYSVQIIGSNQNVQILKLLVQH